jgi:hypothetical protein
MRIQIGGTAHNQLMPVTHCYQHHPSWHRRLTTNVSHSRHPLSFSRPLQLYHN